MRYRVLFVCCLLAVIPLGAVQAAGPAYSGVDDICLTQEVSLDKGKLSVRDNRQSSTYRECDKARRLGGCTPATIRDGKCPCGTLTFTNAAGGRCPRLTKCRSDYKKLFSGCLQEAGLSADEIDLTPEDRGEGSDEPLLPSMQAALDGAFDLGTEEGRTDAVGALVDDGVSKESAESIIHRLAADDVVGAKEAYDRELTLNPSLRENARLVPDEDSERPYRGLRNEAAPVGTTFGDNGDLKSGGCTLEKAAEVIKQMESSGRYGISTPAGRGRVVHGAYQMMTDNVVKWSCEIGKCANPAQFLRNPALQDEVFRHKFGQYWRQFGSASAASQAWLGGPGSVGKYGRSDRFGTTVGSYAAKFARLCGDPSFRPSRNDYTLHGGDPYYGSLTGQNSPFANTNPLVSPQPAQQFPQQQQPPRPPVTPVSQQIRPPGTQTGVSGSLPPAPVQPEASILVQPKELARGNPLTIVWSSVGVSTVDPCRVSLESGGSTSLIARANNGSRTITTTATSTPGTWRFLLQCSISGGRFLERSASTLVK